METSFELLFTAHFHSIDPICYAHSVYSIGLIIYIKRNEEEGT